MFSPLANPMSDSLTDPALTDRRLRVIVDDRPGDPFFQVALEEAILRELNESRPPLLPTLRMWRCERSVVMGASRRVGEEVYLDAIEADGIPLVRRSSGGGTVFHHPDNICYSLFLPYTRPELRPREALNKSNQLLCSIIVKTLQKSGKSAEISNGSDIIIMGRKVSGTAQQRLRHAMLHHGTVLIDAYPGEMERYLRVPPDRRIRHSDFVAGLKELGIVIEREVLYREISEVTVEVLALVPEEGRLKEAEVTRARLLEGEKYRRRDWTRRFT